MSNAATARGGRVAWLAGALVVLSLFAAWRMWGVGPDTNSAAFLSQMVQMRCEETGATWEERRGVIEAELRGIPGDLGAKARVENPATGRATGVMADEAEWRRTIERINREKRAVKRGARGG